MDKEIKDMLKTLIKDLEKKVDSIGNFDLNDKINEAFKEPVKISITKDNIGNATTELEGNDLAILITLAGLEKTILKKIEPPKLIWEKIQKGVGIRDEQ